MSVEITCGKCGEKIKDMKMLKSINEQMNNFAGNLLELKRKSNASK